MLKQDSTLQIMKQIDRYLYEKIKKTAGLRAKTYRYLKDNNDEDKKAKGTKKYVTKITLRARDYKKICLKSSQIENIINFLEKKKIVVDCLKEIIK